MGGDAHYRAEMRARHNAVCSVFLQLMDLGGYNEQAARNRRRIARAQHAEVTNGK
jgi:hypothetical protein